MPRNRWIWVLTIALLIGCAAAPPPVPQTQPPAVDHLILPSETIIRYAIFPAPPYMIGVDNEQTTSSGINVTIIQAIARRLGREVVDVRCPWARCLELMKTGDVDLLSSAYKKPERGAYMVYFSRPFLDKLPIAFYTRADRPMVIHAYEDIYAL